MRKKGARATEEENNKRQRISFIILMITIVLTFIAAGLLTVNWFIVKDLYTGFVINFVGTSFLIAAGLGLCSFFLYLYTVIVFKNPQRLKKSSVVKFAIGWIITILVTITIFLFGANETKKSMQDIKAYANEKYIVKDLAVTDVYRGSATSKITLVETTEGEMVIHWERFLIQQGQTYRFTYLDATKTIIDFEMIQE